MNARGLPTELAAYGALLLPDVLAVAVALDPSLITGSVARYAEVLTQPGPARGMLAVDDRAHSPHTPNITLVTALDAPRLWAMLEAALS